MEINDYLNNITSSDTSTLSNSVSIKALEKIEAVKSNTNTFTLDVNPYEKRSDLSTALKEHINNLSANQTNIQTLDQQSVILTNLNNIAAAMLSLDNQVQIDNNQPSVAALLSKYNTLSSDLNNNSQDNQAESSHDYFDGILGAKPLDPTKIIDSVTKQIENVAVNKKFFADNIEKIENKALETINIEVDKSNKEAPFKNVDFGKNMANFTSANINNVIGSVALSQANAVPANSPKLLA